LLCLNTIPGIGKILSLTFLYEIHDIGRFESVQRFASYARLVKCEKSSAGKRTGSSGSKIGRTVYFMLKRNQAFDPERFLVNS
jgi:transposase